MLQLRFVDGLLDLYLGVGVLVDLGAEQRHQVPPGLDERVRHCQRSSLRGNGRLSGTIVSGGVDPVLPA
jgi:hypothetical protein